MELLENISEKDVRKILESVPDPEIPTLSVIDLGIISNVKIENNDITVWMTPTFSGCPAINHIKENIKTALENELDHNFKVEVIVDFETEWTTDKITENGLSVLKNFGLAPPKRHCGNFDLSTLHIIDCPFCGSSNTRMQSSFGPTLCRSIHYCDNCLQTFEQFKPL